MNEAETRAELIDPALAKAGWGVVEGSRIRREFRISQGRLIGKGQRSKPQKVDYVLQYKNHNLAVIEAKAFKEYYTEGVAQAKDYASKLHVRFAYSSNGKQIYLIDMHKGIEYEVSNFPTPDELWDMTFAHEKLAPGQIVWRERFSSIPFETKGGLWNIRYYQELAINYTMEAIAKDNTRILLTLATGTGKTAIAFQIAWKLYHSRWSLTKDTTRLPRILFLADRNILANQAFNSFSAFKEDELVRISPDQIKKKGRVPTNGSVFFTIFQTFMSGDNDTPYFGDYPQDFFDFIIIDECHRGGANDESTWRAILEYFSPAVQLGLTATPKRDVNIDTYRYFGEPVYTYSLKEGINDGFLTPFRVRQIETSIDEYLYEPDDDIIEGEIDTEKKYKETDFNRTIEITEREKYRVKVFMDEIKSNEKTLVFCASQRHALLIRDLINQYANNGNPNYCHRVTANDGKLGEQFLREFQDYDKREPLILTTSHKLSTGVDAPEVKNIVLLRVIRSMIEFKQIIGRGTRLFQNKDYFTIFDFVKAHQHFQDKEWDGPPEEIVNGGEKKICENCGQQPCTCIIGPHPFLCEKCGFYPCQCEKPHFTMIKVKLSDGKVRELWNKKDTTFWSADGKPITAEQFLQSLFGAIPDLFKNEAELREIWSKPDTRKKLINQLGSRGFPKEQLQELQALLKAEKNDLYDVLAYVAFQAEMIDRSTRASLAKIHFINYNDKQQEFLNFVLSQYITLGVEELDDVKITPFLLLKYRAIEDAKIQLGNVASIRKMFIEFQSHLYDEREAG